MKEITTNGKRILFVEVPIDANEICIPGIYLEPHIQYYLTDSNGKVKECVAIPIPHNHFEILGDSSNLSDEQMNKICETDGIRFKCYIVDGESYSKVKYSFESLKESNGIVDKNPEPHPIELGTMGNDLYFSMLYRHNGAQSLVKRYIVLIEKP